MPDATEFHHEKALTLRLSEKDGRQARFPTVVEFEHAERAGTTTAWCWGDAGPIPASPAIRRGDAYSLAGASGFLATGTGFRTNCYQARRAG